jgi:predicted Zn-dependent peptidase
MNQNYITLIPTDKFKDTQFSIRFLGPNREPDITHRALLAYLMTDRSVTYPTKQAVSLKTDELFALSFDVKVGAYGNYHVLEYRFTTLSERFAQEKHLTQAIDFALACIQTPLITLETLLEAKTNLKAALQRIEDKPNQSALISAMRLGGEGEPLANFSQGRLDLVDSITLEDITAAHQRLIMNDPVYIIGIGELSKEHQAYLEKMFTPKAMNLPAAYRVSTKPFKTQETTKAVKQTALVNLYATQRCYADPDYTALRVMTYLLGQLPNSLLFTEIREKRNLCYSIYSSLVHFDGILTISTGISADQIDAVNSLIETQIERLRTSDYPLELLESAKSLLISNYKGLSDDVPSWMNVAFSLWLNGKSYDLSEMIDEIAKVSAQDIATAAGRLVPLSRAIVKGEA